MQSRAERMLVIGPDDLARRQRVEAFGARGWDVYEAADIRTAIDTALEHQPRAIVTAMVLPDATGFGHVRALRSVVEQDMKIVAVAAAQDVVSSDVRAAGFDAIVSEPIDFAAVHRELLTAPDPDEQKPTTKMRPITK